MRLVAVVMMLEEKTTSNRLRWGQLFKWFNCHRTLKGAMMSIESARMSPIIRSQKTEETRNSERREGVLIIWVMATASPSGH